MTNEERKRQELFWLEAASKGLAGTIIPPTSPATRNPDYVEFLDKMREVHDRKSQDYAQDNNVYSNFEYSAKVSEIFKDPVDRVFATMIGIKLARLAELHNGKSPKNESVADSHLDLSVYTAIWAAYHVAKQKREAWYAVDPQPNTPKVPMLR